ncbi:TetR/AcrR family transcriptional regulator [Phaeovulum sp.]|uniref:TetR/AcrR family transcriptional regulator n=1 Tax=Phaeovulum sp. TaxID=2934796 RepID=UPI0039E30BCE
MLIRKSAEDRKGEIIAVALRLADELGPDRLTTNAVARAVGLTQPAIFRHFASKQALWLAVAEHISETLALAWQMALHPQDTPLQRIEALIAAQFHQIAQTPALPAILFSRELNIENAPLRQVFQTRLAEFQALLAAELSQACDAGAIGADLAPDDGAVLLTSLVQGLAIKWSLGARGFVLQDEGARLLKVQLAQFAPKPEGAN